MNKGLEEGGGQGGFGEFRRPEVTCIFNLTSLAIYMIHFLFLLKKNVHVIFF